MTLKRDLLTCPRSRQMSSHRCWGGNGKNKKKKTRREGTQHGRARVWSVWGRGEGGRGCHRIPAAHGRRPTHTHTRTHTHTHTRQTHTHTHKQTHTPLATPLHLEEEVTGEEEEEEDQHRSQGPSRRCLDRACWFQTEASARTHPRTHALPCSAY